MPYSLKHPPECYPRQVPPKISRWLAVLVAMPVISVILMRIYAVDSVMSSSQHTYVPFSSFRHKGGMMRHEAPEYYYHTRVRRGPSGLHNTWLILGGEAFDTGPRQKTGWGYGDAANDPVYPYQGLPKLETTHSWRESKPKDTK